ncbi:hypothetical protein PybrP1_005590 [[Pythium] brassicae (nom. inval.)]|nr:hypothetical protein PybrP1_005590 [[Pythium] brassicae (nom. inval.)]
MTTKLLRRLRARGFASASSDSSTASSVVSKKKKVSRDSRFATVGLPLLLFVAGGYFALTQFVGGKFEARDHMIKSNTTREFDLEEEHKKITKKLVLDDFEIKPVPKPKDA